MMDRTCSLQLVSSYAAKRPGIQLQRRLLIAVAIAGLSVFRAAIADEKAKEILNASGVKGGLVVHLGCGDGKLTVALRANDSYLVHGLDADAENVASAREHIQSLGLYGKVSVDRLRGSRLPYADNLVNLIVMRDARYGIRDEEIMRVLVPSGVAISLQPSASSLQPFRKPWPDGLDQWTHWDHGPDRNPVSQDLFVGPPRRLQWMDGPEWSKKHWGPRISAMVTANGRLFYVQDETPTSLFNIAAKWVLIARDAFNGVVLWRRDLPDWTGGGWGRVVRRETSPSVPPELVLGVWGELSGGKGIRDATRVMVADGDRLYVPLLADAPVSALDAATGEVLRTYEGVAPVQELVVAEGVLLVCGRDKIRAVEPEAGEELWEAAGANISAKDGQAYFTSRRGRSVVCVDLKRGERLWEIEFTRAIRETDGSATDDKAGFAGPLQAGAGIVLASFPEGRINQTVAISAASGEPLWRKPFGGRPYGRGSGPFFIGDLIWALDSAKGALTALNPQTGEEQQKIAAPGIRYVGHHARCYHARATCRYIIAKERGTDFVDLDSGEVYWNNWVRGPCRRGVMPANGLLYAGQHSCRCYTETALHGFWALGAEEESKRRRVEKSKSDVRLEKGPAYGASDLQSSASSLRPFSWPTYRHDAMRSGSSPVMLPGPLEQEWSVSLPTTPSAPIVAGGKVFVAAIDCHTLCALDAESGELVWQYTAGGRVDSPPTYFQGLVLFGCRDGWVYCLRADDGRLAWRFRAAPEDRLVDAAGQIESAWPVHGSILIKDDVAYCVAGRSSFLDGGLHIYGLDPKTGRVLHTQHLDGPWPGPEVGTTAEPPHRGYVISGALADVLVADAHHVYLRQLRFDATLREMVDMQPNLYESPKLSGENRGGDHKYWDNLVEAGRHELFTDPDWFHRSYFQNFPGRRLYAATGLLGGSWHRRMYWSYGQVVGQYIVFNGNMGYAVQVFATSPREGGFNAGDGYVIHAGQTAEWETDEKLFALRPDQSKWRIRVPLRPVAMTLAGDRLLIAGPPDLEDPRDGLAAVEGNKGALLWAISADTGQKLADYDLDDVPIFDGMAVASGRLYISTVGGKVLCLGGQ